MNWISLHIYHNYSFERILLEFIQPLTLHLKNKNYVDKIFFIRYWEEGPHIRYRVLPSKTIKEGFLKDLIVKRANEYFNSLKNDNIEYVLKFNNYTQEILRYGGIENMGITEKHFQDSSKIVLKLMSNNTTNMNYSSTISVAMQLHLIFVKAVFNDIQKSIIFFDFVYKNWLFHSTKLDEKGNATSNNIRKVISFFEKSYLNQKEMIHYLIKSLWQRNEYSDWMNDWSYSCKELRNLTIFTKNTKSDILPEWEVLSKGSNLCIKDQKTFAILESYIHMTNNRLGIYLRDESFIAFLILKGMKDLGLWQKNDSKNSLNT